MERTITIELRLKETTDDVVAACNMISKNLGEAASEELKSDIASPYDVESRSIICRAHTEAFGNLKYKAMKYLTTGRTEDDNRLERLVRSSSTVTTPNNTFSTSTAYEAGDKCVYQSKAWEFVTDKSAGSWDANVVKEISFKTEVTATFETVTLVMKIPNFNTSATDALKNFAHKYIVDYVMWRFLQNQANDKAGEYKELADKEDLVNFEQALLAREKMGNASPTWV